jgi:hypothetical protein
VTGSFWTTADQKERMSALGQTRHIHDVQDESAIAPIATESLHCGSGLYPSW